MSSAAGSIHWFCTKCETAALTDVSTGIQIEEKVKAYMSKFDDRLSKCETDILAKADKTDLDELSAKNKTLESKVTALQNDISKLESKIQLVRFEPAEKLKRKNNIVIRGLPETYDQTQDNDLVRFALSEIDCSDIIPIEISRLGKKPATQTATNNEQTQNGVSPNQNQPPSTDTVNGPELTRPPARPVRCILLSSDQKSKILQNGKKIRNSVTIRYDPKKVFFIPDQTQLERDDDIKLRKKLKEMRDRSPTKQYSIKGKKIISHTEESARPNSPNTRGTRTFWSTNQ